MGKVDVPHDLADSRPYLGAHLLLILPLVLVRTGHLLALRSHNVAKHDAFDIRSNRVAIDHGSQQTPEVPHFHIIELHLLVQIRLCDSPVVSRDLGQGAQTLCVAYKMTRDLGVQLRRELPERH